MSNNDNITDALNAVEESLQKEAVELVPEQKLALSSNKKIQRRLKRAEHKIARAQLKAEKQQAKAYKQSEKSRQECMLNPSQEGLTPTLYNEEELCPAQEQEAVLKEQEQGQGQASPSLEPKVEPEPVIEPGV